MIKNQWTYLDKTFAENNNKWQVGFFQQGGVTIAGFFDHFLLNNEKTISLEEKDNLFKGNIDEFRLKVIKSLLFDINGIYIYSIPNCSGLKIKKPKDLLFLKWLLFSKKKKFETVFYRQLSQENIPVVFKFDKDWYVGLNLGEKIEYLNKYFQRFGVDPDQKPDIIYTTKESGVGVLLKKNDIEFIADCSTKSFRDFTNKDWEKFNSLLELSPKIIWAIDGHIYFATKQMKKEDIISKLEVIAEEYGLEIAKEHILN